MISGLSWLSGPPERGSFHEETGQPCSKRRQARLRAAKPWSSADGFDYVIRRIDRHGWVSFFVANPTGWSTSWRAATRFHDPRDGAALIGPKTSTSPAGPAAEAGVDIIQLGPEMNP